MSERLGLGLLFCAFTLTWLSLYAIDAVTGTALVALGVRLAR
jgi:hypothetical protein